VEGRRRGGSTLETIQVLLSAVSIVMGASTTVVVNLRMQSLEPTVYRCLPSGE
jgi:hypothetical protein